MYVVMVSGPVDADKENIEHSILRAGRRPDYGYRFAPVEEPVEGVELGGSTGLGACAVDVAL
jgi:hypothetical protein